MMERYLRVVRYRWRRLAWALALLLGVIASCVVVREELAVRLDARVARRAVKEGRFNEAQGPLQRWLLARPRAAEAHFLTARVALGLNRPDDIPGPLERAKEMGHPAPEVDRIWGLVFARAKRYTRAEPLLRSAWDACLGHDPEVAEALARVYLETLQLEPAAEVLRCWARDAPSNPTPHLWWTEIDTRTGAPRSTLIGHYLDALGRDPNLDKARLGLAQQLLATGRHDEAAREFAAYTVRNPHDPEGLIGAGLTAVAAGDEPSADRDFNRALAEDPNHTLALKELATIDSRQGRFEQALGLIDRAIRIDPFDPELRYPRALLLSKLGRGPEATEEFGTIRTLRKEHLRMAEIQAGLIANPSDVPLRSEAARWMVEHGREEEGILLANMVLEDRPDHPETCRLLTDYYTNRGDHGLANLYRLYAAPPVQETLRSR